MSSELKAGFFVLVALGALVFMTTKLTQNKFSFHGTKRYYADIADATGLLSKSKIKMAGLDVGQIEDINLSGKHIRLTMQVAANIEVHKDASVGVKSIGFLGDKYVELFPGSEGTTVLAEGSVLPESVIGGGLDQLTAKTTQVVDNLREITDLLKQAIRGTDGVEGDSRLDHILDNLEHFSESLTSIDRVGDLAEQLNQIAADIKDVTGKVKRGEGTVGKLLTDTQTIDQLNSTLSGVNKFLNKADKLAVYVDARTGYLTGSSNSRSNFALALQPTYDKYYLLGVTAAPRGVTTVTRTDTTTSPGSSSASTVTTEKKENSDSIAFDVQFAKRFGDAVFRIGLFETTGGAAVDYYFFNDKLKLYSEAYRFKKGDNAQVNLGSHMYLLKPFYFWVGGDDIMNSSRSFLAGAGIRFSDQDIKSIVTAVAAGR